MDLQLASEVASLAHARRWLTERAVEAGAAESTVALIRLLGSELLSNAMLHAPVDGPVTVRVVVHHRRLRVEVDDDSTQAPRVLYPPPHETGGRGMQLMDRFSESWGLEPRAAGGKTVWFELPL